MVKGTARGGNATTWVRRAPWGGRGGPVLESRRQDSVFRPAIWRAGGRRRELAATSRGKCRSALVEFAEGQGIRHRRVEHRRHHRDRERIDLRRRDDRLPFSRLRVEDRQAALGNSARCLRAHGPDDVLGKTDASMSSSPPVEAATSARRPARRSWRLRCRPRPVRNSDGQADSPADRNRARPARALGHWRAG